jgi:asparagine synthase (glutamine-hydrolysing)
MTCPRFLALSWGSNDRRAAALAIAEKAIRRYDLAICHDNDGLLVLSDSIHVHPVGEGPRAGVVIGAIFPREYNSASTFSRLLQCISSAEEIVAHHWGGYVAFLHSSGTHLEVVRDPTGTLPCYRRTVDGLDWLSSDLALLMGGAERIPPIDWEFVRQLIGFPHLRGSRTGLAGVDEVLPGCRLVLNRPNALPDCLWSPWTFTRRDLQVTDFEEACSGLRQEVMRSVQALARPYPRVLLELSGGLDSSILAAALSNAGIETIGLNLATQDAEGDERRYARLVAERIGAPLIERHALDLHAIDMRRPARSMLPRPGAQAWLQAWEHHFVDAARAQDCGAFVSGTGGDNVFCSLFSGAPAGDLLRTGRWGAFPRAIGDLATIHDASVWRVARLAMKSAFRSSPAAQWPKDESFLRSQDTLTSPDPQPWLDTPVDVLPGKRAHVRSIIATYAHQGGSTRDLFAPSITPLLSQPVQEWCLRIPSWLWVRGGRDRAVARHSFADQLPAEIIQRRSKGSVDSYCLQLYERHRVQLQQLLADGHLVAAGILDPDALRRYFGQPRPARDVSYFRLLSLVDVEIWLRDWAHADIASWGFRA